MVTQAIGKQLEHEIIVDRDVECSMMDSHKDTESTKEWTDAMVNELSDQVRQIGYQIHRYLGTGYLEKIYENALLHQLHKAGIRAESQVLTEVRDEDAFLLGDYKLDIVVEGVLVIELKAAKDTPHSTSTSLVR